MSVFNRSLFWRMELFRGLLLLFFYFYSISANSSFDAYKCGGSLHGSKTRECSFSYANKTGPDFWPQMFKTCGGRKQSPINIDIPNVKKLTVKRPLVWSSLYYKLPDNMTLTSDGTTIKLRAVYPEDYYPKLSGGPLTDTYRLQNIDFHWGVEGTKGSEHTVDGCRESMEIHAIHERDCTSKGNGTKGLIVAYFYSIKDEATPALDYILAVLKQALQHPHREVKLKRSFPLSNIMTLFTCNYAYYMGSYTTPPCLEEVTWLLRPEESLPMTKHQIQKFRSFYKIAPGMRNNFRPPQPINGRKIYYVQP